MKKLLSLAVLTAMVAAFSVVGAVNADATSSSVSVTANETYSLSLNADVDRSTFTIDAYVPNDTDSHEFVDGTDYLEVVDYTGGDTADLGHYITAQFGDGQVWVYTGTDNFGHTVAVTTDATPDVNEMSYRFKNTTGASFAFTVKTGLTCEGADASRSAITLKTTGQTLLDSDQQCPGTYKYTPADVEVKAPSNGLAAGTYSIVGSFTLVDGPQS